MTLKSWPLWLRLVLVIGLGFVTVFDSAKVMNTKTLIKLEELAFVVLSFYLFLALDYAWWWFPLLFFVPDISMIGYVINQKVGAITYNFIHHKALAVFLYLLGSLTQLHGLQLAGLVMFGHSSLDRLLGFELQQMKEAKQ